MIVFTCIDCGEKFERETRRGNPRRCRPCQAKADNAAKRSYDKKIGPRPPSPATIRVAGWNGLIAAVVGQAYMDATKKYDASGNPILPEIRQDAIRFMRTQARDWLSAIGVDIEIPRIPYDHTQAQEAQEAQAVSIR